jgi:hypothetical protein
MDAALGMSIATDEDGPILVKVKVTVTVPMPAVKDVKKTPIL